MDEHCPFDSFCRSCGTYHTGECKVGLRGAKPISPRPSIQQNKETVVEYGDGAHTEREPFDLTQIPVNSLLRLAEVFSEGEQRYGRDNWRQAVGNKAFQLERANHAIKHLLLCVHWLQRGEYLGKDTPERDLAKVMWYCATQLEHLRLENQHA